MVRERRNLLLSLLHHCYRSLAGVAGRASLWTVRVGRDARAELVATIEFLRASDELVGATPALTRTKPRLPVHTRRVNEARPDSDPRGRKRAVAATDDRRERGRALEELEEVLGRCFGTSWRC
jgi:hypothetical protein